MKTTLISIILCLGLISCSKRANQPSISDICKTQLMKFIEEGTKTKTMAEQGITGKELHQQIANTKSTYELVTVSCAASLLDESRREFEQAFLGWDLAIKMCEIDGKIGNVTYEVLPIAPDRNGYQEFMKYGGEHLVKQADRGGTFLPPTKNTAILLSIAGEHFLVGRTKILQAIQQQK